MIKKKDRNIINKFNPNIDKKLFYDINWNLSSASYIYFIEYSILKLNKYFLEVDRKINHEQNNLEQTTVWG